MTEIFYTNINNISLSELNLRRVPTYRRDKIQRLSHKSDKLRSLGAGLLMEKFIGDKPVKIGDYGKPYCENGKYFNLSHSGDYVIFAVGDDAVGCDIEREKPADFERLGKIVFHENEIKILKKAKNKQDYFYKLWTRKEAFIKCLGEGFHFKTTSLDFSLMPDSFEYNDCTYFFKEYMLSGFKIMLCGKKNDFPKDIVEVNFN